jgi:hypothetical protein
VSNPFFSLFHIHCRTCEAASADHDETSASTARDRARQLQRGARRRRHVVGIRLLVPLAAAIGSTPENQSMEKEAKKGFCL